MLVLEIADYFIDDTLVELVDSAVNWLVHVAWCIWVHVSIMYSWNVGLVVTGTLVMYWVVVAARIPLNETELTATRTLIVVLTGMPCFCNILIIFIYLNMAHLSNLIINTKR